MIEIQQYNLTYKLQVVAKTKFKNVSLAIYSKFKN